MRHVGFFAVCVVLLFVFGFSSTATIARDIRPLPMAAEPLLYMRDGVIHGCGIRLTGGEALDHGTSSWFDVSFNVFRRGIALAQSIAYEIRPRGYEGVNGVARVPLQSTWLKAATRGARLGETTVQHDTLIYPMELDDALSLFETIARREPLTLAIKRWNQPVDSVYSATPEMSETNREVIGECLDRLPLEEVIAH